MKFTYYKKALFAPFFLFLFTTQLQASQFIFKDEVINMPRFYEQVDRLGSELKATTGITLYIVALKSRENELLIDKEKEIAKSLNKPFILLAFSEGVSAGEQGKIDIYASEDTYKHFDKKQVLSPYPWGGTIIPLLTSKIKGDPREKYAAALFNGYADIADQVAQSYGVELQNSVGNTNKIFINILRLFFWGVILSALFYYIYVKITKKREND